MLAILLMLACASEYTEEVHYCSDGYPDITLEQGIPFIVACRPDEHCWVVNWTSEEGEIDLSSLCDAADLTFHVKRL